MIISGGAGRVDHFSEALILDYDAASTANLFNLTLEDRCEMEMVSADIFDPVALERAGRRYDLIKY